LQLRIQKADAWHDYSAVDAVLAVRDFSSAQHLHKPATKLYNAWIAGVPFISGCDSACAAEANDGIEYFTARSKTELLELLAHLKKNPALRKATVEAGQKKSASRNRDAVRKLWVDLLAVQLPTQYRKWSASTSGLRCFFWFQQSAICFLDRKFRS
jgi:hypothetical protein